MKCGRFVVPAPPGFGVGVLLASVVGGAGTDHRAPLEGGRRPCSAAFIGVQQVENELPSRRLACRRRAGGPGVALARTVRPAGRKPGIRSSWRYYLVGTGDRADRRKCGVHGVSLDSRRSAKSWLGGESRNCTTFRALGHPPVPEAAGSAARSDRGRVAA